MMPDYIAALVQRHRVHLHNEKATQADLESLFTSEGIEFERERRLGATDIPDFILGGGCIVEVKIKGRKMAIYRQLERYARYDEATGIVLVTSIGMRLPATIHGKPAAVGSLSAAWL